MNLSITLVTSLQRKGKKKQKDIMSYQELGAWAPGEDPGTLYGDQRLNQRASPGDIISPVQHRNIPFQKGNCSDLTFSQQQQAHSCHRAHLVAQEMFFK